MLVFQVFVLLVLDYLIPIFVLEWNTLNRLLDAIVDRLFEGVSISLRNSLSLCHARATIITHRCIRGKSNLDGTRHTVSIVDVILEPANN